MINSILEIGSKIIDRLFPDKQQAEQAKLELVKMQQAGEFKKIDSDLEQSRIDATDRASARSMASDKAKAGQKDFTPEVLAFIVTLGFFGIIILLMFVSIEDQVKTMLDIMVGYLGASVNQVFGFYYGSSKSSRMKDETISKLSNQGE